MNLENISHKGLLNQIHSSVSIGQGARISSFVVIEEECSIGDYSFIGHFTTMRPETHIGSDTKVGHCVVFEGKSSIGSKCVIQSQSHITLGAIIEDKVFIGPGFIGVNDRRMCHLRPHLKWTPEPFKIGYGSRIGSGAIILPGVEIGENCIVAAGCVVTRNVPNCSIVAGCPSKIIGQVEREDWLS